MNHITNPVGSFQSAIAAPGLTPPQEIINDGKLHRFPTNGKYDDNSGWYVLPTSGNVSAGAFGDWRLGIKEVWRSTNGYVSDPRSEVVYQRLVERIQKRKQRESKWRQEVLVAANRMWESAEPAPSNHPYLSTKGVKPHGLRVSDHGWLVVPLRGWHNP
jgi:putative DNA primase/helicase